MTAQEDNTPGKVGELDIGSGQVSQEKSGKLVCLWCTTAVVTDTK